MKLRIAGKQLQVLPAIAVNYLLYSVLCVVALFYLIDQVVLTTLEDQGKLCSSSWRSDNIKILSQMLARNRATEADPIWRSEGWPVATTCPKSKRIMVMGDSFVWGSGYSNLNTIWWRQLQRELQRRGYNDVEVIAAGMPGAPTRKELRWAKQYVPMYKPDALIWGYVTNDPEEGHDGISIVKNVRLPEDDFPVRVTTFLATVWPNIGDEFHMLRKGCLTRKLSGQVYGWDFADWELKLLEGENWAAYHDTVKQLGLYIQSLPIPSFVVTLPACVYDARTPNGHNMLNVIRNYYILRYAPVKQLFEANGIKWFNLLDPFLAFVAPDKRMDRPEQPLWLAINPANGHPGAQATYVHAVQTANILEANYPQVLGKKSMPVDVVEKFRVNDWLPAQISFKQNEQHIYFVYPQNPEDLLCMPIRKPYVQLNFEHPASVKQITLNGVDLKSADIYFSADGVDQHFDDGTLTELGQKKGSYLTWKLPASARSSRVNTLRIAAQFKGINHALLLDVLTTQ